MTAPGIGGKTNCCALHAYLEKKDSYMIGNRYVAMMDILGFKNMIREKALFSVVNIIRELIDMVEKYESSLLLSRRDATGIKSHSVGFRFDKMHFSDTIVCWTEPFNNDDLDDEYLRTKAFLSGIGDIIFCGFIKGIPLRVGIGFGESYIDITKGIIAGQAIIDAYEAEKVQEWVGGAVHPNCPIELIAESHGSPIIRYPVPVKETVKENDKINLDFALDWTSLAVTHEVIPGELNIRDSSNLRVLEEAFHNYLNNNLRNDIKRKYQKAQEFYEYQLKRRPRTLVH